MGRLHLFRLPHGRLACALSYRDEGGRVLMSPPRLRVSGMTETKIVIVGGQRRGGSVRRRSLDMVDDEYRLSSNAWLQA